MPLSSKTRPPAILSLCLVLSATARSDDWPQFRGPNLDGAWGETGILESFPAEGLEVPWRVPAGPGYSSPVVALGRTYLFDAELTLPTAKERVRCFEASTGKPLWNFSYDVAYPEWAFTKDNESGPNATPVVRDDKLYVLGQLADLHCLDAASGEVLWRKNLKTDYAVKEFFGSASPLVEVDLLILFVGGKPDATVVALDKNTGEEVWTALDDAHTHSSPIVIEAGGTRQLVIWTQKSVYSLDPATGEPYWQEPLNTVPDYAVSTPVVHKDLLYAAGLMFRLDPDEPAATVLWPDSTAQSHRVLSNTSTAMIQGEHLYSARSTGELICLEVATGKQVWQSDKVTDLKSGASIHLTPNGGSTLLYTDRGELIRAHFSPEEYKEVSRVRLLEPTFPFAGEMSHGPRPPTRTVLSSRATARN